MTKKLILVLAITATALAAVGFVPPRYLAVHGFKHCLEKEHMGTWERWCMPHEKPTACARDSWEQLKQLEEHDRPADCKH